MPSWLHAEPSEHLSVLTHLLLLSFLFRFLSEAAPTLWLLSALVISSPAALSDLVAHSAALFLNGIRAPAMTKYVVLESCLSLT